MARVLVIDDEPDVRAVIQEMLEAGGHQVVLAANGVQGLEAHHRHPADVVVTDLFMPEKEGFETIDELLRECPGVKIIAISGGGRAATGARYLSTAAALGVGAVLSKPFDAEALLTAIDRLLMAPDANETPHH